jgi:hypothetical protein
MNRSVLIGLFSLVTAFGYGQAKVDKIPLAPKENLSTAKIQILIG